ncbi:uncharacterized protein LOC121770182 [Salvia splendens]|uniref:uncharacterized protein LOC121770182 n=1 Tax=Salvia splendens TaxID=180675 RepID=UPI001C27A7AF|nr:uncharacterized protein LOC121770182 [Salvia splendens]
MRGYENRKNAPKCAVKIDLRKAFDTVDWDFLRAVLHGLNLHPKFVFWVMQCVMSPRFSLAINGSPHGFFSGKRGLRQGDPMSPTLFIFCMEYLSRLLAARTMNSNFNYHAKCEKERITHLALADDFMLFGRGDYMSMEILANTMEEFSNCSGLEINKGKSNIFEGGKLAMRDLDEIKGIFGFPLGSLPVRYLGVPLHSKKLNIMHYSPLIEKIASLTKKWTGYRVLLATSLPVASKCERPGDCNLPRISLGNKVRSGGVEGPLRAQGRRRARPPGPWGMEQSTPSSVPLWNIHVKKDSLWIKWIHTEFIKGKSIWEWSVKSRDSPLFKRLIEIRDEMLGDRQQREVEIQWEKWYTSKGTVEAYDWFRPKGEHRLWHRFIWKDFIPPKYSFTTWQALRNRLPTRDRLGCRDTEIDQRCPLCTSETESVDHIFF